MKRNVILADCKEGELTTLCEGLSKNGCHYEVKSYPANWGRTGVISELKRYINYFMVAFRYFLYRGDYEVLLCWQQFYALIYSFYCGLFKVKKANMVVAFNFTYKRKKRLSKLYHWFMSRCLSNKYIDYIHVPSNEYAVIISKQFGFPMEKIIVATFGLDDIYEKYGQLETPEGYERNGYLLALGRSNRDFDFLISSWGGVCLSTGYYLGYL